MRRPPDCQPLARPLDHATHLGPARLHRALLLERRVRGLGDQPGQRRLAAAGRPVQDHRVRVALLDRAPKRRSRREQPVLADELLERPRPQPGRQRSPGQGR